MKETSNNAVKIIPTLNGLTDIFIISGSSSLKKRIVGLIFRLVNNNISSMQKYMLNKTNKTHNNLQNLLSA